MGSLRESRFKEAAKLARLWHTRDSQVTTKDWGPQELESAESQIVRNVWHRLYPETVQAVSDNYDDAFLCQIFIVDSDRGEFLAGGVGAANKVRDGVRRGLDLSVTYDETLPESVKRGVAGVLSEHASIRRAQIRERKPAQIFPTLLAANCADTASGILRQLSQEQLAGLLTLIAGYKGKDPLAILPGPVHDTEDWLEWITRYTAFLYDAGNFEQFQVAYDRRADALVAPVGGKLGPPQRDKDGDPLNLFGPMHVKMVKLLATEQTKRGIRGASERGSFSSIARSLNTDHRRVARWWEQSHRLSEPWITPEGNVKVIVTPTDSSLDI